MSSTVGGDCTPLFVTRKGDLKNIHGEVMLGSTTPDPGTPDGSCFSSLFPCTDNTYVVGNGTKRWKRVNVGTSGIKTDGPIDFPTPAVQVQANGTNVFRATQDGLQIHIGAGSATNISGVAVGQNATANNGGAALGHSSTASASNTTALGPSASATHAGATAVGYQATTSATNQVKLGGAGSNVVTVGGLTIGDVATTATANVMSGSPGATAPLPGWVNIDAASVSAVRFVRIGDIVSVQGIASVTQTGIGASEIWVTMPIQRSVAFTTANQASGHGTINSSNVSIEPIVSAVVGSTNTIRISFTSISAAILVRDLFFSCMYTLV